MKFANEHDEYVYEGSVVSGVITGDGDVEAPTGWFAPVTLVDEPPFHRDGEEKAALAFYGTKYLILHESNEGFVTVLTFESERERNDRVAELERAYGLWSAGVDPDDAVAAIAAYRAAAIWSVSPEPGPGITEESQHKMRDDVLDYITQNADDIRSYLEVMGEEWGQAGHDFWLLRNGKADLADRGVAGPAVESVIEAAHAWGPISLHVNDDHLIYIVRPEGLTEEEMSS